MAEQQSYPQFEKCPYGNCVYCDTSGQCIFECCVFDKEWPVTKDTWAYTCVICGRNVSKNTRAVKILICDDCLSRLKRSASCKRCGNSPF